MNCSACGALNYKDEGVTCWLCAWLFEDADGQQPQDVMKQHQPADQSIQTNQTNQVLKKQMEMIAELREMKSVQMEMIKHLIEHENVIKSLMLTNDGMKTTIENIHQQYLGIR